MLLQIAQTAMTSLYGYLYDKTIFFFLLSIILYQNMHIPASFRAECRELERNEGW